VLHQGGSPTTRLTLRQAGNLSRGQQTLLVKSSKGRSGPRENQNTHILSPVRPPLHRKSCLLRENV